MHGLAEAGEEDAGEADGGEVADAADGLFELGEGYLELEPLGLLVAAVGDGDVRLLPVGDEVAADLQVFGTDGDFVLVIALVLVERVVLVDVLDVGGRARGLVQRVGSVLGREGVALDAVVALVALEHAQVLLVVVVAAVEVVVVAGGVVEGREGVALHRVEGDGVEALLQAADVVAVAGELELVVVGQPVKADVLDDARLRVVVERVGERVLRRHASPHRLAQVLVVAVDGYAVLVALEAVLEDVLGDFTQVDVQVAALGVGVVGVEEGVEEPELDVLDV